MRILLTGLMTVHWGRLENGNIGNYYITEATIRELHRVFPGAEIVTTFQMSDEFSRREKIKVLPMDIFYSWNESDLDTCFKEMGIAGVFNLAGHLIASTPYIDEVMKSDLVLDFSGEMWGDHAEPVGKDRFLTVLMKDRVAQLLKKPVVLLAGSQGPFDKTAHLKEFASAVISDYKAILNREPSSVNVLKENGFDIKNVKSFTDVSFLFEPAPYEEIKEILRKDSIVATDKKTAGFILCGFNMLRGPYDAEPRSDDEFSQFAEAVEFITGELGARVFLMSHQNGFVKTPEFKLINGRDYPYARQLYDVVKKRGKVNISDVILAKGPYTPKQTMAIIGQFDIFVTGRIHAFVAAVSQKVPTVIINRGHGGRAHRNIGFARSVGMEDYIADPASADDLKTRIKKCWNNREKIKEELKNRIPIVKDTAKTMFDVLKE
ncbi:MAG TPA: polysaccharide pyruvyl transferase family protein, partial [Candidatus Omnitrophota bacterium]|nr:polysaccharide pyruvyl transferase family protein [Candidatus Omnitrophota bacterium]